MKTKNLVLAIVLLTTAFVAHGQTNQPPPTPPTNAVSSTSALLTKRVAEMETQVAEMAMLLEEQAQANAELLAALKSVQPAPQPAPQPQAFPQQQPQTLYRLDDNRFVPVTAGVSPVPRVRQKIRGAPGPIVGIIRYPERAGPEYYEIWANGRSTHRIAPSPR